MFPVLFRAGAISVNSWGFFVALGLLAGDYVIARQCRDWHLPAGYSSWLFVLLIAGAIPASRFLYILSDFRSFRAAPILMVLSRSGWVWYGAMFGGALGAYAGSRLSSVSFLCTADMCAPAFAIAQAIGRLGCFAWGDGDWGPPTTLPWGVSFTDAPIGWGPGTVLKLDSRWSLVSAYFPGVRVHPSMLYESILYAIVFLILWKLRGKGYPGRSLYLYLLLAGAARFVVEFWRINPRVLSFFSEAQLIAIVMILFGGLELLTKSPSFRVAAARSRTSDPAYAFGKGRISAPRIRSE